MGSYLDFINIRGYVESIKEDNKQLEKSVLQLKQKQALTNLDQYIKQDSFTSSGHCKRF